MDTDVIDLEPTETQELSPNEFLRLYEEDKDDIASVKIIPPVPGTAGFGRIIVRHKSPVYAYRGIKIGKFTGRTKRLRAKAKRKTAA